MLGLPSGCGVTCPDAELRYELMTVTIDGESAAESTDDLSDLDFWSSNLMMYKSETGAEIYTETGTIWANEVSWSSTRTATGQRP